MLHCQTMIEPGGDGMSVPISDHEAAVNAIYAAAAAPERWSATLGMVAEHIGAMGGMLAYHATAGEPSFLVSAGLREDVDALYLQQYVRNPYSIAAARMHTGRAQVANRIVDVPAVRRSAFHADILAPTAIEDFIMLTDASLTRRGSVGGVSFPLSRRQAEQGQQAAGRLDRLAPHLSRAIDLTLQLGRHRSAEWQFGRMLDAMPTAALLLDRRGGILRTNAWADALLREGDGIRAVKSERLCLSAELPSEAQLLTRRVAQALRAAEGLDGGLGGSLRITRGSGRPPLVLLVTPLPPPAFTLWEAVDGGTRAMVQIVDVNAPAQSQAEILRGAAGLTAAETRVAALIGGGFSAPEAARTLGLSLATVKTHLTRCFDKTGARSQAALARLLASIPMSGK
jgi:DNA-binding CsgD family transcriptional regulator